MGKKKHHKKKHSKKKNGGKNNFLSKLAKRWHRLKKSTKEKKYGGKFSNYVKEMSRK